MATSWRLRAVELAQAVGAVVDEHHLDQLPFIRDEIIYPGLTGGVYMRINQEESPGRVIFRSLR